MKNIVKEKTIIVINERKFAPFVILWPIIYDNMPIL